ncbi:SET domain-containing protein [Colletotrichum somersetense]|nr:SET domain-containing protein [Colletotrichum somersetense]
MDVKDVSKAEEFAAYFQQLQITAERTRSMKGKIPLDHPSPSMLVGDFNRPGARAMIEMAMKPRQYYVKTSQMPSAYLPCNRSENELQPLPISKMRLEEHHRGTYILVRIIMMPHKINVISAVAEDEEEFDIEDILPQGSVCLIKEPFFKKATDGKYSLRVDHVGDFCLLARDDERIPQRWRSVPPFAPNSESIRSRGNTAAIAAATTAEHKHMALLSRSLANLRVQRPEKALLDAVHARSNDTPTEKGLFRESKAHYALEQFDLCAGKLQQVLALNPENKEAEVELERTGRRIVEQVTGIRDSPGRGRGLFTTKSVKAGELLLCPKAFSYVYADQNDHTASQNLKVLMNLDSEKMTMGGQATLVSTVVQKLYHNPETASRFMDLYHGDYEVVNGFPGEQVVVDTFLVERIIGLNCFGAPRTTLEYSKKSQGDRSQTTCGIWTTASFINHSCVGNCSRSFIDDMMVVRASRDLDVGAELLFCYQVPKEGADYQAIQKGLKSGVLICRCELCEEKKATSEPAFQKRQQLLQILESSMRSCRTVAHEAKVFKLLSQVEDTYSGGKGTPRPAACAMYLALGQKRVDRRKFAQGLEFAIKGLEALGFEVVASPRGKASGEPTLEIKKWGEANEYLIQAFLTMFRSYEKLAPELCQIARSYAETMYAIVFGEKDTIGTMFEEFK